MHLDLNTNQVQAITCPLAPTIVIAGPGSGKTHVIINRINYMIHTLGCQSHHILVVTFSKLAALEMKERFINQYQDKSVNFGTLHSTFYKILRGTDPDKYAVQKLLSEHEKKIILQNLFIKMEVDEYEDFIEEFIKHLTLMKNQLINPKYYYPDGVSKEIFIELLKQYEHYKEVHHKFDFDDMLVDCYYLLSNDTAILKTIKNHYQYILIDEFQDINLVQFEIIKMLVGNEKNIFVVGDDDQSIYKFRGAKPEFLLDFKKHFTGSQEIFLEINYRSTQRILDYSSALIASNKTRYLKNLTTPNPIGKTPQIVHCKDAKEQTELILQKILSLKNQGKKLSSMAIIFRTNIEARPIVGVLLPSHIPFCLREGMVSLYEQWLTKDILSYLFLAQNTNNIECAIKLINKPKRYISKAIVEEIRYHKGNFFSNLLAHPTLSEWQKDYIQKLLFDLQVIKEKSLFDAIAYIRQTIGYDSYVVDYAAYRKLPHTLLFEVLDELQESSKTFQSVIEWETFLKDVSKKVKEQTTNTLVNEAITLTTMHGSKGLEFDYVFIINLVEGNVPHHKSSSEVELEEERRLFYVAITRAKQELYFYIPAEKYTKPTNVSLFIEELLNKYLGEHLQKDAFIIHNKFGRGKIINSIENNILEVEFSNHTIRKIDGNYCVSNGIIHWEE